MLCSICGAGHWDGDWPGEPESLCTASCQSRGRSPTSQTPRYHSSIAPPMYCNMSPCPHEAEQPETVAAAEDTVPAQSSGVFWIFCYITSPRYKKITSEIYVSYLLSVISKPMQIKVHAFMHKYMIYFLRPARKSLQGLWARLPLIDAFSKTYSAPLQSTVHFVNFQGTCELQIDLYTWPFSKALLGRWAGRWTCSGSTSRGQTFWNAHSRGYTCSNIWNTW